MTNISSHLSCELCRSSRVTMGLMNAHLILSHLAQPVLVDGHVLCFLAVHSCSFFERRIEKHFVLSLGVFLLLNKL